MKTALWIIGVCLAALFFWWIRTPEIQWYTARSYIGKKVTVVGPVIQGTLDSKIVTMTMGIPNCESPTSNWQSSLHITVPRNIFTREWTQKDLEKGTVMKRTGRVEIGIGNSVWLNVPPQSQMHAYEVHPRKDKRGVDLISDMLPFGRLWYGNANAVANAIGYAEHYSRSHNAVIRVYDDAGNVMETHEHEGDFKER